MKEERELENLIKTLRPEASLPRLQFEAELKQKLLKANSKYDQAENSAGSFFDFLKFNPKVAGLFAMVILIGLVYSLGYFYTANNKVTYHDSINTVESTEKFAVLTNIYQNNPQSVLTTNFQTGLLYDQTDMANNNQAGLKPETIPVALAKNYNFYHVTYHRTSGPMSAECNFMQTDNVTLETYAYELRDAAGVLVQNYSKIVTYDTDNNLLFLSITDNAGLLEYKGGAYATRSNFTAADLLKNSEDLLSGVINSTTLPTPDVGETEEIGKLFDSGIKINRIVSNGRELYQLISTNSGSTDNVCANDGNRLVYIVNTVDPEQNYQITETAYYLEDIKVENLIMLSRNTYERDNLAPGLALRQYFTLEPGIPIR